MTGIPREAAVGFARGARDYERGRPGYPDAAVDLLAEQLGLGPGRRIVDLAAGTGKLTRALVRLGAELVAVEPVAEMAAELRRAVPGVQVLEGTAERMPLADAGADAVTVAQAFHWFDVPRAAAEIHRVLAPGGALVIIRNEWDGSVPWIDEMQRLIREHGGVEPRFHARAGRAELAATGRFEALQERVIAHPVEVDLETLGARVTSLSYVAMLGDGERRRLVADLEQLVREHDAIRDDGLIETPYLTHVAWAPAVAPGT